MNIVQKIITSIVDGNKIDYNGLGDYLIDGWYIKFPPSVIPAYAGNPPKIIYVIEKEFEENIR